MRRSNNEVIYAYLSVSSPCVWLHSKTQYALTSRSCKYVFLPMHISVVRNNRKIDCSKLIREVIVSYLCTLPKVVQYRRLLKTDSAK
jgi:hypothetical protein